jgi:hypothetical protein
MEWKAALKERALISSHCDEIFSYDVSLLFAWALQALYHVVLCIPIHINRKKKK